MRFDYEDCRRRGLLRGSIPSDEKALRSIGKAENWLKEAEKNIESGAYDSCLISTYLVMFHSARAVLIRDGVIEKSHYCVARYLEEKYVKNGPLEQKWVDILDRFRNIRHSDQYDVTYFASEEDARGAIPIAGRYLKRIKKLLEGTEPMRFP